MNRTDLETAVFGFCGIAQVAFLLMLRGLWDNEIDLRIWGPALALPGFVAAAAGLTRYLLQRTEGGGGFHGQPLMISLGVLTVVCGLFLGGQLSSRLTTLIELAMVGVGLGLAAAVGWQLRALVRQSAAPHPFGFAPDPASGRGVVGRHEPDDGR